MATTPTIEELQRLERTLFDAMIDEDYPALDALLSDNIRYIHSSSAEQNKQEYFEALRNWYDYQHLESVEAIYNCSEGVGVVINTLNITSRKKPNAKFKVANTLQSDYSTGHLRVSYVWVDEPGRGWRLLLRHATATGPRTAVVT